MGESKSETERKLLNKLIQLHCVVILYVSKEIGMHNSNNVLPSRMEKSVSH